MAAVRQHLPLLCRLNMHHRWQLRHTEDGGRFRQCRRCGKDRNEPPRGPGDWAAGLAPSN